MRPIAFVLLVAVVTANPGCSAIGAIAGNSLAEHLNATHHDLIANGATNVSADKSVRDYTTIGLLIGLALDVTVVSLAIRGLSSCQPATDNDPHPLEWGTCR